MVHYPSTVYHFLSASLGLPGADPGFQVGGGGHLKKLRRAEGGAKIVGVFRVKNHDFTPKNHIFRLPREAPLPTVTNYTPTRREGAIIAITLFVLR